MANNVNPQDVAQILRECSERFIMPRYNKLEEHEISSKTSEDDLVTIADKETEIELEKILPDLYPGSIVVGEEGVSEGRVSTEFLKDNSGSFWVVDPVDGTYNFRHGKRHFGVMAVLVEHGQAVMSWVYDILGDKIMIAEKGSGAYINDKRLLVNSSPDINNLKGYAYYSVRKHIKHLPDNLQNVKTLRCSAHEYLHLTSNQANFGIYSHCKQWDHLPGGLAFCEAGGVLKCWDGSPYMPAHDNANIIAACSNDLWDEISPLIKD